MKEALRSDLLQGVTRGDLCLPPFVDEPADAHLQLCARGSPIHSQHVEPGTIHGLEGQGVLKPGVRRRVELSGGEQSAVALDPGPIALKAQRGRPPRVYRRLDQLLPAGPTKRPRAFAFQLSTREHNPIFINILRGRLD